MQLRIDYSRINFAQLFVNRSAVSVMNVSYPISI